MDSSQQSKKNTSDQQVQGLLDALLSVVNQLEKAHQALEDCDGTQQEKNQLYATVLQDMERLSNLLQLVESQGRSLLTDQTCGLMDQTIDQVRQRATTVGTQVALNRVRSLQHAADRSIAQHEHPIGKSFYLRDSFINAVGLLRSLCDSLPQEHLDALHSSADRINKLITRDRTVEWLQPFRQEEPCRLIDVHALQFRVKPKETTPPSAP